MNNISILIYNAARICFEESDQKERAIVTLIQHLDCNFMRNPKVWEHYFLLRINRKLIDQSQHGRPPITRLRARDTQSAEEGRQQIVHVQ